VWDWWAHSSRAYADHVIKKAGLAAMMHQKAAQATLPSPMFAYHHLFSLSVPIPRFVVGGLPMQNKKDTGQWSSSNVVQIGSRDGVSLRQTSSIS
ncbi:MAG: hypothetical protein ACKPKO_62555, partial [Candidatus Fonsibacter sp.]